MFKKVIVVQSPYETVSGYGAKSRDIVRSIIKWADKNDFDVKLVSTPWGHCPRTALESVSDRHVFDSKKLTSPLPAQPEIFAQISIPNESQTVGKYNILFTSGIETTLSRGEWVEGANKMNLIVVPSEHAKQSLVQSKYKKKTKEGLEIPLEINRPVEVLFEGSDTSVYNNKQVTTKVVDTINKIPEDFCFLFVGHWLQGELGADRKDVGMLIKTFLETFKNQKNSPALILKTNGANFSEVDKTEVLRKIDKCKKTTIGDCPNVYLLHGELTDDEMNSLYNHPKVKAHVSFTHGEGYGRPLQEASLSGKPVIAPAWSGQLDFLDKDLAVLLEGGLHPVHPTAVNEWIIKESKWFNVNYSLAARTLQDVFKKYDKYLTKAEALRKKNMKEKSLESMDKVLDDILSKNIPKFQNTVSVNLPKLNKVGGPKLPELSKPHINLPKLTKIK